MIGEGIESFFLTSVKSGVLAKREIILGATSDRKFWRDMITHFLKERSTLKKVAWHMTYYLIPIKSMDSNK